MTRTASSTVEQETGSAQGTGQLVSLCVPVPLADQVLSVMGDGCSPVSLDGLEQLGSRMKHDKTGLVLFACLSPAPFVAALMRDGLAPKAALDGWAHVARAVLAFTRQFRRRTRIIDVSQVLLAPEDVVSMLGVDLPVSRLQDTPDVAVNPILLLIAAKLLADDRDMKMLAGEFEASMLLVDGDSPADGAAIAHNGFESYQRLQSQLATGAEDQRRLVRLGADLARSDAQLKVVGRQVLELEAQMLHHAEQQVVLAEAQAQTATQKAALDDLGAQVAQLNQTKADLGAQIVKITGQLTGGAAQQARVNAELDVVLSQNEDLTQALLADDKRCTDLEAHQVAQQAALDKAHAENARSQETIAAQQSSINELGAQVAQLKKAEADLGAQVVEMTGKLDALDAILTGVVSSKSHKMMEPIRQMRAVMLRWQNRQ